MKSVTIAWRNPPSQDTKTKRVSGVAPQDAPIPALADHQRAHIASVYWGGAGDRKLHSAMRSHLGLIAHRKRERAQKLGEWPTGEAVIPPACWTRVTGGIVVRSGLATFPIIMDEIPPKNRTLRIKEKE